MTINRRIFLEKLSQASLLIGSQFDLSDFKNEEQYWQAIKDDFAIARSNYMYLNSGSSGVLPNPVLLGLQALQLQMNSYAPYQVWNLWQEERTELKRGLAKLIDVPADEIAIQRNTTEALNNILLSIPIEAKDEVIAGTHEYPSMLNGLKNRSKKEGFQLKLIDLKLPCSNESIYEAYAQAINSQSRYVLISHISFNHGRIFPMAKLKKLFDENGIEMIVDGAHSFGQISFKMKDIGASYYGTSLHKWLSAPHGSGLLYIKKDLIPKTQQLLSASIGDDESINKFEHLGTRAFYIELGIRLALDYHNQIGPERKEKRLRTLNNLILEQLSKIIGFNNHSSTDPNQYCGVLAFTFDQVSPSVIKKRLKKEYGIIVKTTQLSNQSGIRISPNIFTLKKDILYFTEALKKIVNTK